MTDVLDELRRNRREPEPPDDVVKAAARRSLQAAMRRETRAQRKRMRPWTSWRPRRLQIAAVALAAGTALAVAAFVRSNATTEPALAAGPLLHRLARVAAAQQQQIPGPGQYLYTTSRALTEADTALPGGVYCRAVFEQYRQNWIAANGEGLFRETDGPAHYSSARERNACASAPRQRAGTSNTWAAPGCLSINPVPLAGLPRDPAQLRARLLTGRVEGGRPGPAEAFTQVGDLLRETDAPSSLRAALYLAAAGLPGVKSLGTVSDKLGRRGVGLALDSDAIRHELIFSASTSALLAEQSVLVGRTATSHAAPGTVLDWSAYTAGVLTDELPSKPPLPLRPPCVKGAATALPVPGHADESVLVGYAAAPTASSSYSG
jgi:hypothetical protein